jgi:hypothetical protein
MAMSDVWTYRSEDWTGRDLTGYAVEASFPGRRRAARR